MLSERGGRLVSSATELEAGRLVEAIFVMKRKGLRRKCRILEKIGDISGSDILTASVPVAAAELQLVHWQDLGPESEMIVV